MTDRPICIPLSRADLNTLDQALRALAKADPGSVYVNFPPWRTIRDAIAEDNRYRGYKPVTGLPALDPDGNRESGETMPK